MIYQSPQNPNTHLTVKERQYPSFPTKYLFAQKLIQGKVLDFGAGLGKDVEFLKAKDFEVKAYAPYYSPEYPQERFDTILCNYVLNVLLPEEQSAVLMCIAELLKPTGKAYFTVRRDITQNGFRYNPKREVSVYQCNVTLPYKSIYKTEHCEIYQYQPYHQLKHNDSDCPFCNPDSERMLISEIATAYAIFDKYPISEGHALIIPKRHIPNYFDLSFKEQSACWLLVNRVKTILQNQFNPEGFNVGINVNAEAGQTVFHAHIHLIPRYKGDVENPRGGIRQIIPLKANY